MAVDFECREGVRRVVCHLGVSTCDQGRRKSHSKAYLDCISSSASDESEGWELETTPSIWELGASTNISDFRPPSKAPGRIRHRHFHLHDFATSVTANLTAHINKHPSLVHNKSPVSSQHLRVKAQYIQDGPLAKYTDQDTAVAYKITLASLQASSFFPFSKQENIAEILNALVSLTPKLSTNGMSQPDSAATSVNATDASSVEHSDKIAENSNSPKWESLTDVDTSTSKNEEFDLDEANVWCVLMEHYDSNISNLICLSSYLSRQTNNEDVWDEGRDLYYHLLDRSVEATLRSTRSFAHVRNSAFRAAAAVIATKILKIDHSKHRKVITADYVKPTRWKIFEKDRSYRALFSDHEWLVIFPLGDKNTGAIAAAR